MLKKIISVLLVLSLVAGFAACGGEPAPQPQEDQAATETEFPEMELILLVGGSEKSTDGLGCIKFKELVEEATGGKVTVNTYFNWSLFVQNEEIPAMQAGNLDMNITNFSLLSEYMPKLQMFAAPYTFRSIEHKEAFFESDLWKELSDEIAEQTGLRILGEWYSGARCIDLRIDRKVTSRADLADIKLRVTNNAASIAMGKALGANPIGMASSDVYMALQTGTVDGEENPIPLKIAFSFHEVFSSVTQTNHALFSGLFAISENKWQSLSPELQQVILEAAENVSTWVSDTRMKEETDGVDFLKEQGKKVYELTNEEMASYQKEVVDFFFADPANTEGWDMNLYKAVQDIKE